MDTQKLDQTYIANTYARFPVTIVKGKGSLVWDDTGKEYIDLSTGIAVDIFGVADEEWVAAVTKQLGTLQHISNLYYTEPCVKLAQMLCEKTGMKKVFFGNSGAEAKYPKIAKQFHLPFQSGNDRVLKAMNRHYNREEYLKLAHYGRQIMPELVLTSDVIVGFPGETEEEFEDTISLIEDVRYDALFTFIFSPRAGTPAAKMDDPTPKEEKNRRFDRLCAVQNRISLEIHQGYVGKTVRVLCDGRDKDLLTARTEGGRLVRFAGDDSLIGQFLDVTITGCTTWSLVGELR